jgi:hypothetical protein
VGTPNEDPRADPDLAVFVTGGVAIVLFPAATLRRLRRIRMAVDPGELFVANHRIPADA